MCKFIQKSLTLRNFSASTGDLFRMLSLVLLAFGVLLSHATPAGATDLDTSPTTNKTTLSKITSQIQAPVTPEDKFQYDFMAGFGGNFYGDEKQQEQTAAASLYTKINYKPISFAEFNLFAGFNLISGHSQYRYGDSESHSGFSFKEAAVRLKPFDHFKIGIGALAVQDYPVPSIIVSDYAFPGLSEEVMFGTANQHIQLFAEQMIPTSSRRKKGR